MTTNFPAQVEPKSRFVNAALDKIFGAPRVDFLYTPDGGARYWNLDDTWETASFCADESRARKAGIHDKEIPHHARLT